MTRMRKPASRLGRAFIVASLILVASGAAGVRPAWSHPLHTTLTEIALDPADGSMRLTIRAFADDFSAVVAKHARKARSADYQVSNADILSYLASMISVEDPSGKPALLTWGGLRQTGDLMWITVHVPSVHSLHGVKLVSALLFDAFSDQVNIVQTSYDGRHRSMLFSAGDGRKLKSLP